MNVLSLFDGMSCGQIALNRLGVKYNRYIASEVDKYAITVTKANYPNTEHIGDVRNVSSENLPKIDLLIGGSPCQNFSFAGTRKGMTTKDNTEITSLDQYLRLKNEGFEFEGQSYLFWEYVRILKDVKPTFFMLENVKMVKKWEQLISSVLGVGPIAINSALVSAQNRQRLYWTNIHGVVQPADKGIYLKDIIENGEADRDKSLSLTTRVNGATADRYVEKSMHQMIKVTDDNPCQPKIQEYNGVYYRKLTPVECERLQTVPDNYTARVSNTQRYKMLGNGWTIDVICHILKNIDILI